MEIALIFGGVVVSIIIQLVKTKLKLNAGGVMLFVVIFSLIGGAVYKALLTYGLWESFLSIIVSAGAFYSFIIKNIKDLSTDTAVERESI